MQKTNDGSEERISWPNATLLLLAARTSEQRDWVTSSALELMRRLAGDRTKVVVADLRAPENPVAERLGFRPDDPGIVDVLFHGASFTEIARRPASETFYYLPIGNEAPAADELYTDSRWERLADRFREADAHLLLCVALDEWREAGPIPGFSSAIVLNGTDGEIDLLAGTRRVTEFRRVEEPAGGSERPTAETAGILAHSGAVETLERPEESGEDEADSRSDEPGLAPVGNRDREFDSADDRESVQPRGSDTGSLHALRNLWLGRRLRKRRGSLVAGGAAAVVVLLALWWILAEGESGADVPLRVEAASGPAETRQPSELSAADPDGEATTRVEGAELDLPYSVLIASYSSYEDALGRQREWNRAGLPFYVAPTVVKGVVYYRVFAGLLPERDRAVQVMSDLVGEGIKDTVRDWDIRPARLAFDFGTFAERVQARQAAEALLDKGVPAYVVPVPAESRDLRSRAYRVYAGGYESAEDARPLREQIDQAGLDARLVERVGMLSR